MVYSVYCAPLARRTNYRWLMSLAREAIESDDINPTVNDVLIGVVSADKAFRINQKDEALDVAKEAGERVGPLFRQEARRVFRMHGVDQRVASAFEETAYRDTAERLRYSRGDDHVLLLYSDGPYYHIYATEFESFLTMHLGFHPRNIIAMCDLAGDSPEEGIMGFTRSAEKTLKRTGKFGNVVVYYSGFGGIDPVNNEIGGFVFAGSVIPYKTWATPFADHQGNIVFVNDTSFAAAAHLAFKDLGLLPDRSMVLSACGLDEGGVRNLFSKSVMKQYGNQEIYSPTKIQLNHKTVTVEPITSGDRSFDVRLPKEFWTVLHRQHPKKVGADFDYLLMKYPMNGL
ncbi:MAG TPA: hypothetical protein VJA47_02925 [archaeon]|nr:hypothetical protein [archaeon]